MVVNEQPMFRSRAVNHVALRVTDLARSRDFYVRLFGARVIGESATACFLEVGGGDFIALFPSEEPHVEHFCLTVDDYEPDKAAARLEAAGLTVRRAEDRVFFYDPDELLVQLSGPNP
jgi:catechol 2,3-dioxygenase-like lactoylglutathione lyase family enzyme